MVAVVVLALSATGLLRWAARATPVPVVKGIQLGAGLSLVVSAGASLLGPLPWLPAPGGGGGGGGGAALLDNRAWALAAFAALLATQRLPRFPYALAVLLVGLGLAFATLALVSDGSGDGGGGGGGDGDGDGGLLLWRPRFALPRWSRHAVGMGVAQLPLTTLNSVIAASALASDLFPGGPVPGPTATATATPTVTQLGVSVAAMNLAGCWFGAMPVCHGAGGLAAQYRFGARSGASVALLGLLKMALGLLLGERPLLRLLRAFPRALLGVMVVAAGLELARVGQSLNHGASDLWESAVGGHDSGGGAKRHKDVSDDERARRWTVMLTTTAGILAFKNDAVGFVAGLMCHWAYAIAGAMERRADGRRAGERAPLLST